MLDTYHESRGGSKENQSLLRERGVARLGFGLRNAQYANQSVHLGRTCVDQIQSALRRSGTSGAEYHAANEDAVTSWERTLTVGDSVETPQCVARWWNQRGKSLPTTSHFGDIATLGWIALPGLHQFGYADAVAASGPQRAENPPARAARAFNSQCNAGFAFCANCRACASNQLPAAGSTMPQSGSKWFCASPVTAQGL